MKRNRWLALLIATIGNVGCGDDSSRASLGATDDSSSTDGNPYDSTSPHAGDCDGVEKAPVEFYCRGGDLFQRQFLGMQCNFVTLSENCDFGCGRGQSDRTFRCLSEDDDNGQGGAGGEQANP